MNTIHLHVLPELLAVCQLSADAPLPDELSSSSFWCAMRTNEELSIVIAEEKARPTWKAEKGWRCIKVSGPLDFSLTGILASIANPLGREGISIFAISTYNTDYILVRADDLEKAVLTLAAAGFDFSS